MNNNNKKPINEAIDPRFGKTSPKDSMFRDFLHRIRNEEKKNNTNNNQTKLK